MRLNTVVMYRDRKGEWRWRYVRSNGRVMADSGEGYRSKRACENGARHVLAAESRRDLRWVYQPEGFRW